MNALQQLHDSTAYYTKQAVVDDLLDMVDWPRCGGRLLDPGAGDGAFLIRAVERLEVGIDDLEEVVMRVEGWEIHAAALGYARHALVDHLHGRGWDHTLATSAARLVLRHEDFLAPGPRHVQYSVAAGNPPYLRYARLPEHFKRLYTKEVPDWARGDLLHAFLAKSGSVLAEGGRIAFVTADRWLFNESAAKLREELGRRFGVERVERLDVGSAFYQAKTRRKGTPPRIHPVAVLLGPDGERLSRAPVHIEKVHVPHDAVPLAEVATIRLAPWLGPEGVFVLDENNLPLGLMGRGLPAGSFVPCVDTDDIKGGELGRPRRIALRTTRDQKPPASIRRHLELTRTLLPARARQAICPWAPPESWGPLPFDRPALLIPRIARELVSYRLPAGILPINHNLTVVSSAVPIATLEAALRSSAAKAWIAAHAPRLESGYLSITTNLLRRLPVSV